MRDEGNPPSHNTSIDIFYFFSRTPILSLSPLYTMVTEYIFETAHDS